MDGILYHGEHVLPGAREFIARISPFRHLFVTNNPVLSPGAIAERLSGMGFNPSFPEQILTSADATALWLSRRMPDFRYYAIGGRGLHEALEKAGKPDALEADFVVIGEGPGLDYDALITGINLVLSKGAQLISTNPDVNVDSWNNGTHLVLPGGGALVAPFELATAKKAVTIGKPEPLLFEMALERLNASPEDCIMIGDRPDTDIVGAAAVGMRTALVRTGRFRPGTRWPAGLKQPDWDEDSLSDLAMTLQEAGILDSHGQ